MPKRPQNRVTTVHQHPRQVPISKKNPSGITIVDQHLRRIPGTYLDRDEIYTVFKNYDRKSLKYPTKNKLKFKNSDKYDEIIAVWVDYFNKKFALKPPLDPDVFKALIASESSFQEDPPRNKIAMGLTQITKQTLKIVQDPSGEAKAFTFKDIRQKDLKDPNIAIPIAVRWLLRKREIAQSKLRRTPTDEETILEYKGLLKSSTKWKEKSLESYRTHFKSLKSK